MTAETPSPSRRLGWPAVLAAHVAAIGLWHVDFAAMMWGLWFDPTLQRIAGFDLRIGRVGAIIALAAAAIVAFALRNRLFGPLAIGAFAAVVVEQAADPLSCLFVCGDQIKLVTPDDAVVLALCVAQLAAWTAYVLRSRTLRAAMKHNG